MSDSRLKSLSEISLSMVVGFAINFMINALLFPSFGIPFDPVVYLEIGGFYTITSLIIQYPVRRLFNKYWKNQPHSGSLAEVAVTFVTGWILCYITGLMVLPLYGMKSTLDVTIVNTIGSITTMIRRYLFRRMFQHYGERENLYTLAIRLRNYVKKKVESTKTTTN